MLVPPPPTTTHRPENVGSATPPAWANSRLSGSVTAVTVNDPLFASVGDPLIMMAWPTMS